MRPSRHKGSGHVCPLAYKFPMKETRTCNHIEKTTCITKSWLVARLALRWPLLLSFEHTVDQSLCRGPGTVLDHHSSYLHEHQIVYLPLAGFADSEQKTLPSNHCQSNCCHPDAAVFPCAALAQATFYFQTCGLLSHNLYDCWPQSS